LFESGGLSGGLLSGVVVPRVLGGRQVAEGLQEPPVIGPVDPSEGGIFELLQAAPRPLCLDQLRLEQAGELFGQRVAVGVADAARRCLDSGRGQPISVADGQVL
jgi:hypothetical protein